MFFGVEFPWPASRSRQRSSERRDSAAEARERDRAPELEVRLRAMRFGATAFACWPAQTKLVGQSSKRSLVAREGFEPSKPLGRQIYSLLRLTASLPRRYVRARIADGTAASDFEPDATNAASGSRPMPHVKTSFAF